MEMGRKGCAQAALSHRRDHGGDRQRAHHPDRGRRLPEIPGSGLRELLVGNYRIVYRRVSKAIEVLTVFEGHRLLRREELPERR